MKIISHRGNIRGASPDKENRPSYIDCAIGSGYDVEIDLRMIDGELWLGPVSYTHLTLPTTPYV